MIADYTTLSTFLSMKILCKTLRHQCKGIGISAWVAEVSVDSVTFCHLSDHRGLVDGPFYPWPFLLDAFDTTIHSLMVVSIHETLQKTVNDSQRIN